MNEKKRKDDQHERRGKMKEKNGTQYTKAKEKHNEAR